MLVPSGIFPVQKQFEKNFTERRRKTKKLVSIRGTSMNNKNDQNWKPNKNSDSNKNQHAKEQNPFIERNNNHRTKFVIQFSGLFYSGGVSREHLEMGES